MSRKKLNSKLNEILEEERLQALKALQEKLQRREKYNKRKDRKNGK